MHDPILTQLLQQYGILRDRFERGLIDQSQFQAEFQKLIVQDSDGTYWSVDSGSGSLLYYDGATWVEAPQAPAPARVESASTPTSAQAQPPKYRKILGYLGLLLPIGTAFIWFSYSSLSPRSEGWDCITPLTMAVVPLALLFLERPISLLLRPIQPYRDLLPRMTRRGAALALPFVLGLMCSSTSSIGYGGMRMAIIFSSLGSFLLLHDAGGAK